MFRGRGSSMWKVIGEAPVMACSPRALCSETATEGTRRVPQVEGAGEAGQVAQSSVSILPHLHQEHRVYTRAHTDCTRMHTAGSSARLRALCRPGPARPVMGVMDELCPLQFILEAGTDRVPVTNRAAPFLSLHEHTCQQKRRREKTTEKPGGCQGRPLTDAVTCFCDFSFGVGRGGLCLRVRTAQAQDGHPRVPPTPTPVQRGRGSGRKRAKRAPAKVSSL